MLRILLPLDDEVTAIGFDQGSLRFALHSLNKPACLEARDRTGPCITPPDSIGKVHE